MTPNAVDALLAELAERGIELQACEDRLRFRPRAAVTPDLAARLQTHKAELLALLCEHGSSASPAELPDDWRLLWEERAAIIEYDGGQPRARAELLALKEIKEAMRKAGNGP